MLVYLLLAATLSTIPTPSATAPPSLAASNKFDFKSIPKIVNCKETAGTEVLGSAKKGLETQSVMGVITDPKANPAFVEAYKACMAKTP